MADILDGKLNVNFEENNGGFDYAGYMGKDGTWVIQKTTTSTGAVSQFKQGGKFSDYPTAWANRTSLDYGYPTRGL